MAVVMSRLFRVARTRVLQSVYGSVNRQAGRLLLLEKAGSEVVNKIRHKYHTLLQMESCFMYNKKDTLFFFYVKRISLLLVFNNL